MALDKFVDMELDDEDKLDLGICCGPSPDYSEPKKLVPQYPWGLRISLTQSEIEKLGLDEDDVEAGSCVHLKAFARVTNVSSESMRDSRTGEVRNVSRVELQIEKIAVEDEDDE